MGSISAVVDVAQLGPALAGVAAQLRAGPTAFGPDAGECSRSDLDRLLALARPASVRYESLKDTVTVAGKGNVLLAAFHQAADQQQPTARLHVLTEGMTSGWPA